MAARFELNLEEHVTKKYLLEIARIAHPLGSTRQENLIRFLDQELKQQNISTFLQEFTVKTPNGAALQRGTLPVADTIEKKTFNLLVRFPGVKKCAVALASHTDTKSIEYDISSTPYLGANDSGSSTAGLISLAHSLAASIAQKSLKLGGCSLYLWFFDGEEAQLQSWDDGEKYHPAKIQDNTYGSRYLASQLVAFENGWTLPKNIFAVEEKINAVIVLDMIGSKNPIISRDSTSDQTLLNAIEMRLKQNTIPMAGFMSTIGDDHTAFVKKKIPAADIIDFNNLQDWHKSTDTVDKLSLEAIHKVISAVFATYYEIY